MTRAIAISSWRSRHEAGRGDPQRPGPVGRVGAASEVGEVVGEVREDLQQQGHRQAAERGVEAERRADRQRGTEADDHPGGRGRQVAGRIASSHVRRDRGPAAVGGTAVVAHGRRGNFAKSGRRFSRNAFDPSWASSVV